MKERFQILRRVSDGSTALISALVVILTAPAVHGGINVWTGLGPGVASVTALAIDPTTPTTLYTAVFILDPDNFSIGGVFKSIDGGGSWQAADTGLPPVVPSGITSRGKVITIVIDPHTPTTLYAATNSNGVYKSTDGGVSWNAASTGLPLDNLFLSTLAIDPTAPNTLYVGGDLGVFKSTDSANSWQAVSEGLPNPLLPPHYSTPYVRSLVIDPLNPGTLYVGTVFEGVFKSMDYASTWRPVDTGLPAARHDPNYYAAVSGLVIDPTVPSTLYAETDVGLYNSTDGADSWHAIGDESTAQGLIIDPLASRTLYGFSGGLVLQSTDGAASWRAGSTGLPSIALLAIDPSTPSTLYAGTSDGVFKSTDSAGSWYAINSGLLRSGGTSVLAVDPSTPSTIYAGPYKSTDAGATWSEIYLNMGVLALDPTAPNTLYAGADGGGFKSTDGGINWSPLVSLPAVAVRALAIDPRAPTTLYAAACTTECSSPFSCTWNADVYKSTDAGASWGMPTLHIADTGEQCLVLAIDPSTSTTVYAGTAGSVYKSTDGGATWSSSSVGGGDVTTIAIDPLTPRTLYAGTAISNGTGNGAFKSTDGGTSWQAVSVGLPRLFQEGEQEYLGIRALIIDPLRPDTLYAAINGNGYGGGGYGVFRSTDGARTWHPLNTGLPAMADRTIAANSIAIDPIAPNTLYVGTAGGGVYSIQQIAACTGDCNASGDVTTDKLVTLVNIALDITPAGACAAGLPGGPDVDIALIVKAVINALNGCG